MKYDYKDALGMRWTVVAPLIWLVALHVIFIIFLTNMPESFSQSLDRYDPAYLYLGLIILVILLGLFSYFRGKATLFLTLSFAICIWLTTASFWVFAIGYPWYLGVISLLLLALFSWLNYKAMRNHKAWAFMQAGLILVGLLLPLLAR